MSKEDVEERLEEGKKACLWRKGLGFDSTLGDESTYSTFNCPAGHEAYPHDLCTAHLVYLNHSDKSFGARMPTSSSIRANLELSSIHWPIKTTPHSLPPCNNFFDEAFIFILDISTSPDDCYYRLHTSTFIPLYSLMMWRRHFGPVTTPGYRVMLFPAVEDYTIKEVDWNSNVFIGHNKHKLSYQFLEAFNGGMELLPLVQGSLKKDEITCARIAHFGVGVVNMTDPALLHGFSLFMRSRLGLPYLPPTPAEPTVCLVRRSINRRILNEEDIVSALSKFVRVEVVQFDALSYREQVAQMRKFTVLVGFHGAELLNALYMSPGSVTIQLVPYNARNLPIATYAELLRANGPYLEWQNGNERMSRPNQVNDKDNSFSDTLLDTDDISDLVESALRLGVNAKLVSINHKDNVMAT